MSMSPAPFASICGGRPRDNRTAAITTKCQYVSHFWSGASAIVSFDPVLALERKMSAPPAAAAEIKATHPSAVATSAVTAVAENGTCRRLERRFRARIHQTSASSRSKTRTMPRPIPFEPPVVTASFAVSPKAISVPLTVLRVPTSLAQMTVRVRICLRGANPRLHPARPSCSLTSMFQSFDVTTRPDDGPPRLARLREEMKKDGVDAFLVPRADKFQGEYVADCDARLSWLTGFTGSAGFAAVTKDAAGVFVDGRYRLQVRAQVADAFTPVDWPETKLGPWLKDQLADEAVVGFDPWLHTFDEIEAIRKAASTLVLRPTDNLIDRIWADRPAPPKAPARKHPIEFAGEKSGEKRERIAKILRDASQRATVVTLPDSICWLLNIRGSDIPRNPVVHAFAILHDSGRVSLFSDLSKFEDLGPDPSIDQFPWDAFEAELTKLDGPVRVDRKTAPVAVSKLLEKAGVEVAWGDDPILLPKACKNSAELQGMRDAHLTDAVAMVEFLAWLDREAPKGGLTEIDAATKLEGLRRGSNALQDISFETISGAGPNGAIIHYRVTEETNRAIRPGELYLVDSGGQYLNGTTDITRTIAVGDPTEEQRACYTRVLQGMIAISQTRFPKGIAGRDLDALARAALWRAGLDYDHGTGHGVGAYLSVHEGPQRLSRLSEVSLKPGMILSNEPGYYREGAFGIRIENLIVVREAEELGDKRKQYDFETLTFVPLDRRLIAVDMLGPWEVAWLDRYHGDVREKLSGRISEDARAWLDAATAPLA